ncbi:hypothetical protein O1611_g667 [Lasiodiplodia mahajangana]|uniref:Uncharacterized protein n=1 Tax=Lasiodiplodia mahajangana TaxID=1108764 RepID=A0ACC2JZH9_9PEZI|nr:hypothetical protein O1611_g667 [Lasiodiplodia mahajangana]
MPKEQDDGAQDQDPEPLYATHNVLGNVVSGAPYQTIVKGPQLLSKLLRVSREARQAALGFYRVHLPCCFGTGGIAENFGTLPFNPEFDVLRIQSGGGCHNFVHFLHDIRAYDKLGVGLLNLALDNNGVNNLLGINGPALECDGRGALISTLSKLRQMFFVSIESGGRTYLGARSGIHTNDRYEFHRSRPIMSAIPSFDRLSQDPRGGLDRDLSRVYVGTFDPRRMVSRWQEVLHRWNIAYTSGKAPEYSLLASTRVGPHGDDIISRGAATEWLQVEEERWLRFQQRHASRIVNRGYTLPLESSEELEKAPRPAMGFWLFPIEAIGELPGPKALAENGESVWEAKRVVDMRKYRPELWLAHMA